MTFANITEPSDRLSALSKALACQPPARGEELNSLLRSLVANHATIEALSKYIQHRAVFTEHISHEIRDPAPLSDNRQMLDEHRPETTTVQVIGDLDRDFGARLIELDIGGVPDEHAQLVMGEKPVVGRAGDGREARGARKVSGPGEEPQATGFQAQSLEERPQRRLILGARRTNRHQGAVSQYGELRLGFAVG